MQPVLAHIRPDHPGTEVILALCPEFNWNPVVGSGGVPEPAKVPGHMVCGQLFVMVNMDEKAKEKEMEKMMKKKQGEV